MTKKIAVPAAVFVFLASLLSCNNNGKGHGSKLLLGAGLGIHKASIVVDNLDSANKYYRDILGFSMPEPDEFKKGIYAGALGASSELPDGSAIQLLRVSDSSSVAWRHGTAVFSLSTSSADTTRNWLSSQGFSMDTLRSGRTSPDTTKGWDWDDGGPEWRVARIDKANKPGYLPAFVEWVGFPYHELNEDWSTYLFASRPYYSNANGVIGISAIRILVHDLKAARKEFIKMGFTQLESKDAGRVVRFRIARSQELQVVSSTSPEVQSADFTQSEGARVFSYRFEVSDLKKTEAFFKGKLPAGSFKVDSVSAILTIAKEHAYGVQLEFIEESKEQAAIAGVYNFKKDVKLDTLARQHALGLYTKYCALCHGKDRQGYAADFAPSLRSRSLMSTTQSSNYLKHAVNYGREGTAMAAYGKSQGGPLNEVEVELLLQWIYEMSGVEKPIDLPTETIDGNIAAGKVLYNQHCVTCHGEKGEGVRAPAIGNPMLLATASDAFIHHAIAEGRDGTPMPSFKDSLSATDINSITAFIRSRASGWTAPAAITVHEPLPKDYILNPGRRSPKFNLRDNRYVSAEQLLRALKDSTRMVILDARSKAGWHQAHIPGAISVPYYETPDIFMKHIPKDSTMIVVYCACPHAASQRVVSTLTRFGYRNMAILDEGVLVWAKRGYPVQSGKE